MSDQVKYVEQCAVTNSNCMTVRSATAPVHLPLFSLPHPFPSVICRKLCLHLSCDMQALLYAC